ncbi:MAG: bifunctional aspartate kinase/homoserine dehydrogenase I [Prolixibacteraceae bacterium]|jgi:aspartokinase/homoserine dehydrogenase 1|nr:bifunctional aspartate kinase/homoserine dehydrogenase I [Prolixibacteraceae bacterium]
MKVIKFGGTSVGSAGNIRKIDEIVRNQQTDLIIVVSAVGGVTDLLLAAANEGALGNEVNPRLEEIWGRHEKIMAGLFDDKTLGEVKAKMKILFDELEKILQGVRLIGELTPKTLDKVMGFGERLSSLFISRYLNAELIDSAANIRTDKSHGRANVDFNTTYELIGKNCTGLKRTAVAPGFISSASDGTMTTLGRGGSDYTAALFAAALNAEKLEIWTDVDGFMTADPRVISKAYPIPQLTYSEALELSHFGAKVIYPPTILPVYQKSIPVQIKNTMNPSAEGTLIGNVKHLGAEHPIKGISSIDGISLFTVQGLGMVGVTGIAMRLFGALARQEINVILISQASSENSISFAIDSTRGKAAEAAIQQEFEREIASGLINKIGSEEDLCIIAIVGENMKHSAGIAGKLFYTIGKNGINVVAIAQGASEQNISWVVKKSDLRKTLNVVHESFFLSPFIELNLFLVGIGTVGRDLITQISQQQQKLQNEHRLKLRICGVANSRKMAFDREGFDPSSIAQILSGETAEKSDMKQFCRQMIEMNLFNSVFVDCTAEKKVADQYHTILNNYISIVAANKVAASSEYNAYRELKELAANHGVKYLFETNVGAGLPLISTINDLKRSGDRIVRIEAVLSGTLNYIFNTLSSEIPLSTAIRLSKEKGFSEPDPRIDLSGVDVVRKLVILGRESGYKLSQEEVVQKRFIPDRYFNSTLEDFWRDIHEMDAHFEAERLVLEKDRKKWRFVGLLDEGRASVSLQSVGPGHPFYDLEGSNNIVLLTTERYNESPMLIKGYGAGAAVTAAGVFADLIKVANI